MKLLVRYDIPDEYASLDDLAGPLPAENADEGPCHHYGLEEFRSNEHGETQDRQEEDDDDLHGYEYANLDELEGPPPDENPDERGIYRHRNLEEARTDEQWYE